ncbi:hypothetical protein Vretimale_3407 [Volvox reticuliferus]|nr:hypothetical protein Vretimale_3407 [Volvox reticuliferus]
MGWARGAMLGWHHDANREYLSQRHLSAVLYLNTQGEDFGAGDFRFKDGPEPLRVAPRVGRLVAYTADRRNVHCVEEVAWGERCTLTCWFSLDPSASEDPPVLQRLCRNLTTWRSLHVLSAQPEKESESRAPEVGLNPGQAVAFNVPVLRHCWWQRYLGPGLPSSMYQLPAGAGEGPVRVDGVDVGGQSGDVDLSGGGKVTSCDAEWTGGAAAEGGSEGAAGGRGTVGGEERGGVGREGDLRLERLRHLGLFVVATAGGMRSECQDGLGTPPRVPRKIPQPVGTTAPPGLDKINSTGSTVTVRLESPRAWFTTVAVAVRPGDAAGDVTSGPAKVPSSHSLGTGVAGTPLADAVGNVCNYGSCSNSGRGGPEESPAWCQEPRDVKTQEVEDEEEDNQLEEGRSGEDVWVGLVDELEAAVEKGTLCQEGVKNIMRSGGNVADNDAAVVRLMPVGGLAGCALVWFPNLSEALLAVQFAAYVRNVDRFRSVMQVKEASKEFSVYAHMRMEELLKDLPKWQSLGFMLSGG